MHRYTALAGVEGRYNHTLLIGAIAVAAMLGAGHARATPLTEGSILPNYAVASVGPNASITVNSGPIAGKVLLGDGTTTSSSGGGNGSITGGVWDSGTVNGDNLQHIQTPPAANMLPATTATTAFGDAAALSAAAASLAPNHTFTGTFSSSLVVNGISGGTEVIDFANLHNPQITINGNSSETFVFNVSGLFQTNQIITLNGVSASQILWNFTGTSGTVFQTSGGDVLSGTFLATDGGDFQFSNLDLDGQLIDTDGHMQFVSGSTIPTAAPFSPPAPVPEPITLSLFGAGLAGAFSLRRRKT